MPNPTSVINLDSNDYFVIDLDTGTVLGTNLVLVKTPEDEETMEEITNSDSAAWEYGTQNGIPLQVTL